jgi:hypothetical protein
VSESRTPGHPASYFVLEGCDDDVEALFVAMRALGADAIKEHASQGEQGRRRRDDLRVKNLSVGVGKARTPPTIRGQG